ncbi:hypothetical protein F2981_25545 (plasmid) [Sinorhizobium meliloti]|nr:hypothetical protein [Sinorhizobium meliloti]
MLRAPSPDNFVPAARLSHAICRPSSIFINRSIRTMKFTNLDFYYDPPPRGPHVPIAPDEPAPGYRLRVRRRGTPRRPSMK